MSEECKRAMWGRCRPGHHVEEVDIMGEMMCLRCSGDHVTEFGNSIGVVEGPAWENGEGPEVFVRWDGRLRYSYDPAALRVIP